MQVTARQIGSVLVLELEGELIAPIAPAFLRTARRLLATAPAPLIAVDMGRVPRVDASGFGALVTLLRDVERRRGGLCLVGIRPDVRILLEIMQLHLLFEVCSDVPEAADALRALHPAGAAGPAPVRIEPRRAARPLEGHAAS